jgi:LSD1 subclass zinc finger protein
MIASQLANKLSAFCGAQNVRCSVCKSSALNFLIIKYKCTPLQRGTQSQPASFLFFYYWATNILAWWLNNKRKGKLAVTQYLFEEEYICILFLYASWDHKRQLNFKNLACISTPSSAELQFNIIQILYVVHHAYFYTVKINQQIRTLFTIIYLYRYMFRCSSAIIRGHRRSQAPFCI